MMNEIELQGITNGLSDLAARMEQTRLRLARGISDPASPAQAARFTAALAKADTEIGLLLDCFGAGQLADTPPGQVLADMAAIERDAAEPWELPHPFETALPAGGKCDICGRERYDGIHPLGRAR
jgi:hypothetical protein